MSAQSVRTALSQNRQFVAFVLVVLLVMGLFPGSPGRILLAGGTSSSPPPSSTTTPPRTSTTQTTSRVGGTNDTPSTPPEHDPPQAAPEEPLRLGDIDPAEPREREPGPSCQTDALFITVHALRGEAGGVLGDLFNGLLPGEIPDRGHVAGESLERLVRLVTGCEAEQLPEDPDAAQQYMTGLFIEAILDLAGMAPDAGVDPILLPPELFDVSDLLFDVLNETGGQLPVELAELFGPYAADIREYCGTAELLLLLAPILVADSVPLSGDDLTRLMAPLSGICGLFDDDSFLDDAS